MIPPHPTRALEAAGLARPSADESFDRIARLVQRHLGAPTALVTIVLPGAQVYPGAVGLPAPFQHTRRTTFPDPLCGEVVETGQPLVVEDLHADPRLAATSTVTQLGVSAYAGFPVHDRNGTVVGTVCALDDAPHAWSPTDLATLADLAAACTAELRLRLERQRAHSIQRVAVHATRRTRLLLDLTERFAGATTLTETVESLRTAGTGIGTMWAGMALTNESGTGLTLVERDGTYPHLPRHWRFEDDGIAAVTRSMRPTFYRDGAALLRELPWFAPWVDDSMGGMAFLPLVLEDRLLGLAALLWHGPRDHDAESRRTAGALASCVVQALTRIRVLEERHRVATTLQTAMLTELPEVPHLELASTYASATRTDQVGGDWYDAVVPDSGSCVLMIGDVTGHDMQAAARMGQLRSMLRTLVWCQDATPAALVRELDRANRGLGLAASGTTLVARVDRCPDPDDEAAPDGGAAPPPPDAYRLRWSSAGHPRPVVVRADGRVEELAGRTDLMLGVDPATARRDHAARLAPGDTLVLYTDGLVESRTVDYATRTAQLHDALRDLARGPVPDLPRALVDRMVQGQQRDDVAVLVARAR
ncbi:SpoIIE family protein phosphatase [Isoptericola sp. BMS4]|uniref:SpoIIE family protein phosphatase n=1 Tax=Isoptericola sp. BMS4 TaxID=2527875 RepID=UPI0014244F5C|nr:SpoIIE family protein phosphatase [Isoptericola sp. BMS4]